MPELTFISIWHLVQRHSGGRLKGTLADTALFGGLFVLVCDIVARIVIFPFELPIELVIGIIGPVIFIVLIALMREAGGRRMRCAPILFWMAL